MIKKVKISKLELDYDIYPREHLNSYHADEIVEAIKAGVRMPPIVIDKATSIVVDGWHRIEAVRRVLGDKASIEADVREYPDKAAMFAESIKLNASHGQRLSRIDEAHCLAKAQDFQLEPAAVASLLNITAERAEDLVSRRLASSSEGSIVLKGSTAHLAGQRLSDAQATYNRKAGGLNQTFYINQVIAMIEGDAVDWDNVRVTDGLKRLMELLEESLKSRV